jgi:crotonobetainyl-CoA:carnitine CoA-transferase CaiB-like acyl-CoA transferase
VLQRLGLGYDELLAVQPELILCSISGYGQDGPLRERAGHDIDYQALGGTLAVSGSAEGDPAMPGVQLADVAGGGLWAALRIVAALHGGGPAHLDVSMTEGVMAMLLPWFGDFAFSGEPLRRGRAILNGGAARYRIYRAADQRHLALGALEPKFWRAICQALGHPSAGGDLDADPGVQQRLGRELQRRFARRGRDEWAEALAPADACVEPVLEMDELAQHPQHRHREMFFEIDDPRCGRSTQMRLPLGPPRATRPAPAHGEHTDEVLAEIGILADDLAGLRARGTVR